MRGQSARAAEGGGARGSPVRREDGLLERLAGQQSRGAGGAEDVAAAGGIRGLDDRGAGSAR